MKTALLVTVLLTSNAVAAEVPRTTVTEAEQTKSAQDTASCLPLRTPGIAESASSYNDYVKSRCRTDVAPANTGK